MNIFNLELRNLRKSVISGTLSVSVAIFALLSFFPAMQTESMKALAGAKLEGMDPALLEALGLSAMLDFSVITNFFGYTVQYIGLAIMVLIVQQAVTLFIKEESDGTIEYLCAKPVSRDDIVAGKLLAHLAVTVTMLTVYTAVATAGYLTVSDYTFGESVKETATFFSAMLFVAIVFSAVGTLLSTLIKSSKDAAGMTIGIVFGTFIMGVMSSVVKQLSFLKWFSPMDWIKTEKLMSEGILWQEWIVGITVILVCTAAAWLRYRKKDLLIG